MQTLRYAIAVACLTGTLAAAAPADAPKRQQPNGKKVEKAVELSQEFLEQVRQAAAMIVYLDPVTGEMRAPTQQERAALVGQTGLRTRTAVASPPIRLPGGGVALRIDPSQMDFAVAYQGPGGKIRYHCTKPSSAANSKGGNTHE